MRKHELHELQLHLLSVGDGTSNFPCTIIDPITVITEIKKQLKEQKPRLEETYGVRIIGIFGSYARNEQRPDSDIDILIELKPPPRLSLIDLVELEHELSDLLGRRVQTAVKGSLRRRVGRRILGEVVPV